MLAGFAEGASSIAATAAQGAESAVTGSGVVNTIDPNSVAEVGMYGGAGRAMEILAERYIEEAESMFPVIEVPSGRRGTVVIQEGQKLEWKPTSWPTRCRARANTMSLKLMIPLTALLFLGGCATVQHDCELGSGVCRYRRCL